jgi:predicted lipid-binding transport protein (Tim44 family)
MKIWTALLAVVLTVGAFEAEAARRLGGGGSVGKQSSNVTQRQSTPPAQSGQQPGAPANSATAQKPGQPPAAAAQPAKRPWGAMLGGLAAGLGLAWLASALGFGEGLAQFMMFALIALVIMVVIGLILRARRGAQQAPGAGGYAYQGAGAQAPAEPRQYSPDKVGNDASARPWERSSMAFEAGKYAGGTGQQSGVRIGSALEGSQNWGIPAGFDVESFVQAAKRNFTTLQDAWDRSDTASLRAMMTDEMLREIQSQLAERERTGGGPNKTDVVMLEAQLLGIEDLGTDYMASVEFSGMIREDPSAGPSPFREVWNMTKPKDGSAGWLVAGVQALQ